MSQIISDNLIFLKSPVEIESTQLDVASGGM